MFEISTFRTPSHNPHDGRLLAILLVAGALLAGCSRTPEQKAERYLAAGQRFFATGDYARSILQFKNAVQVTPRKPDAHYLLGMAYLAGGDAASAVAEFETAAELDPRHPDAQLMLARMMLLSRNSETVLKAEARIRQVLAISPQNVDAWNALALADWQLGRREEAERQFQDALERFPQNLKAAISLAQIRMARGDFNGAEELLKAAVAQQPEAAIPQVALGEFYALAGRFAEAEERFRRAVRAEPQNGVPLLELAALQSRMGRAAEADTSYRSLAALPGGQYRAAYASHLFDSGRHGEAIAEFERLCKQEPENRDRRTWLIRAYFRAGRMADAQKILAAALRRNPSDVDALVQRSTIHLLTGNYAGARADLARVLHFQPDSARAHYLLAKVHGARGALLSQRQELSEALRIDPEFLFARIELAQALIASNEPTAALQLMNDAPEPGRNAPAAIAARNWALVAAGEMGQLRSALEKALPAARTPDLLLQKGLLHLHDREYAAARTVAGEILAGSPEDVRALELLGRSYVLERRPALAAQKLLEHASAHPSADVQYFLGQWDRAAGDRAQARAAFAAAIAANPAHARAVIALAEMDASENRLDEARKALSSLLAGDEDNTEARLVLASIEEVAGDRAAALANYRKIVGQDPDNLVALNNLAYLLADFANKPDEALPYAHRAKNLDPDNPAVDDTLGWVLYCKGLYASAAQQFTRAVADETTARRLCHLAMAYFKTGDVRRGRETLEAALRKDPHLPEAAIARKLDVSAR